MSTLTDRALVVSGASRGIGLAIAIGAARRGANVVLLAKACLPYLRKSPNAHVLTLAPPLIMGDAAVEIFSRPAADVTGQCYIDSELLADAGVTDLARYGGGDDPILDIFVDKP